MTSHDICSKPSKHSQAYFIGPIQNDPNLTSGLFTYNTPLFAMGCLQQIRDPFKPK